MSTRSTGLAALLSALALAACSSGSSPPPPPAALTVSPAAPGVVPGQQQTFTASAVGDPAPAVTWSVQEGSAGGSITPAGVYTAPTVVGTYHVIATRVSDATQQGSATVYVVPPATCSLPTPQPSALPAGDVISLGVHAVGETVTFQVPPGTGSVTLVQQGAQPLAAPSIRQSGTSYPNTVVPRSIRVDGVLYFDQSAAPPDNPASWGSPDGVGIGSMFFEVLSPWTGTVTVPNTSSALQYVATHGGVPSGTWAVEIFDYATGCQPPDCVVGDGTFTYPPGRYDVKALLRPGTTSATGTTDVTFYLVTDKLTAATAPGNASVARMESTLAAYFGRAGISVGTVRFVDMPASVKARYAAGVNIDDETACGSVATLLAMSQPGNALSLFLVNSLISADGKYTYVGLDGTVPGPSSVGGTVASGALVSVADLSFALTPTACQGAVDLVGCGADRTAYVAAHEAGHFLGLYHVTEQNGTLFDPVQDTPMCPVATCAPGAQQVVTGNCLTAAKNGCGGGDNLMFWLLDKTLSVGALSPQQSSIMRANPLVQ